ncbi:MAG: alpha-glucan phosphorylase [Candidatus Lloydbacteria bacterium RIFOXYC12_FULL_46_25]|uniref:glycogen phosphorylase n=1 Tax=Candidatus Lloydbacteria bacterium RIFOXYC12_FULL_46_25 TaxID=1798670 RepID=A0A1G2E1N0_9BACT|nr:MAG: alpha-glucan phosphorylase [Candidatus Lloydbacteria bacterium RIFOXYC12_FULL_46_25]
MSSLSVGYFCMEMGIENEMPTYAGGLGVLAGDMLASCADLDVAVIGVTLIHRKGYFKQRFDQSGWQFEEGEEWNPFEKLALLPHEVSISILGRSVRIRAWLYKMKGVKGNLNPVIFLDTDVEGNTDEDRHITDKLYAGDARHRLIQEAVLGIGGMRILEKIGATNIQKFHMNEGHSALLTIELYRMYGSCDEPVQEVRRRSVFTTHTPVAAGHDQFDEGLVNEVLGSSYIPNSIKQMVFEGGGLNMTRLGLNFSQYVNGVAKKHGEVTRQLFPGYQIESITNGVHAARWAAEPFARLYDKYLPGWRIDPYNLRYALSIPLEELWRTHEEAKGEMISYINQRYGVVMNKDVFTIGFARRATAYKRGNMLFSDIERLLRIAERSKGIQIIYAGKAHPNDNDGKLLIQQIIDNMRKVGHKITCVYVEDYDMEIAKRIVAGVDLWLNTPTRPQEASGTSGMKAALNGVPHFSVLDGWWLEGHIEGVTGWSIGPHPERAEMNNPDPEDIEDLYTKLEYVIIPRYENERDQWIKTMRQAISINGSFFNTHRMVEQYVLGAYFK